MGVKNKIKNGKTLAVFDFSTVSRTLWESKSKLELQTISHFTTFYFWQCQKSKMQVRFWPWSKTEIRSKYMALWWLLIQSHSNSEHQHHFSVVASRLEECVLLFSLQFSFSLFFHQHGVLFALLWSLFLPELALSKSFIHQWHLPP